MVPMAVLHHIHIQKLLRALLELLLTPRSLYGSSRALFKNKGFVGPRTNTHFQLVVGQAFFRLQPLKPKPQKP